MAKKKSEKSETSASKEPSAKKPSGAKKSATATTSTAAASKQTKTAKPARQAAPIGSPLIDTSLAAQTAARMLAAGRARRERQTQQDEGEEKKEGSLINQIKSDLNKPAAATISNVLNKSAPEGVKKPSSQPFAHKQVGHNQTFGADLTRSGVPRRTSG